MRSGHFVKIAHLSDLHLLSLAGVPRRRFLNKRMTGWANLRLKRSAIHRASYVRAIARDIRAAGFDHVVITGDLTNLALESEFELVRDLLERELGLDAAQISLVPGNHDLYTRGSLVSRRFERYLQPWLTSDLPSLSADVAGARFPVVKIRGGVAIIALSSAVPRPPFVAAGELGGDQLQALARILAHPEVARRDVVLAVHHPVVEPASSLHHYIEGLRDAPALLALLRTLPRGLVVHGHLHRRVQRTITTTTGLVDHVGATSASLHHDSPDRMAGYNVYEMGEGGTEKIDARVYDPGTDSFRIHVVPQHA
jgi:3',5'-cyclic AMP phosphodiesterase CpdA